MAQGDFPLTTRSFIEFYVVCFFLLLLLLFSHVGQPSQRLIWIPVYSPDRSPDSYFDILPEKASGPDKL